MYEDMILKGEHFMKRISGFISMYRVEVEHSDRENFAPYDSWGNALFVDLSANQRKTATGRYIAFYSYLLLISIYT
jgi:hypothetical protein